MQTESQKRGKEGESKIGELSKELASLEKRLDIAREEERLLELRKKEVRLRADFEQSLKEGKENEKLRRALADVVEEIWIEERKLVAAKDGKNKEVERLRLELNQRRREFCEKESLRLLPQVDVLQKQLTSLLKKLSSLNILWDQNNPTKLIRSKSRFILIRKKAAKQSDGTYLPAGREVRDGCVAMECQLHRLQDFTRDGWEVFPKDQNLELEPLNTGNSYPVKTFHPPEVINRIQNLDIKISAFSVFASQVEEDAAVKKLEEEIDGGTGS